jgi:beta-lactamase class A
MSLLSLLRIIVCVLTSIQFVGSSLADGTPLQRNLETLAASSIGRMGACVLISTEKEPACVRGNEFFPLQSVMKLVVSAAVLDAVDRGALGWGEKILVKASDASPGPRAFSDFVKNRGSYEATVEELVRHAIIDSDSTSVDLLILRLGGISSVQSFLERKRISDVRIDRNERHLQTEAVGLTWKSEYADLEKFEADLKALPTEQRNKAWEAHLSDPRDKATPVGMVKFLNALVTGQLLSASSTAKLVEVMGATATGKDRLRAGLPAGWAIGHKTGTGRSWNGVTETTNDVGVLTAPNGTKIAVAVFLAGSKAPDQSQARSIARVAEIAAAAYGR